MRKLRVTFLFGLLSLALLHSGFAHAASVGTFAGGETTQWTWDSSQVPLDVGGNTIVYNVHAFNFVSPFAGGGSLAYEDPDNFTLQLDISNLGTAFSFTEVSGDGSNDFGQGAGLDVQLVATKSNGVVSATGSITPSPGSVFDTPWGVAGVDFSLGISDVTVAPLAGNVFAIGFGDAIDVSLTVDSTTTFIMNGAGNFTVSLVPAPPALWLFTSALTGLIALARKNAA